MSTILQLNPPIPVETPLGSAEAILVIDYGNDYDLQFCCLIRESRIAVTFRQPYIRMQGNLTMGRMDIAEDKLFRAQRRAGKLNVFDVLQAWLKW